MQYRGTKNRSKQDVIIVCHIKVQTASSALLQGIIHGIHALP